MTKIKTAFQSIKVALWLWIFNNQFWEIKLYIIYEISVIIIFCPQLQLSLAIFFGWINWWCLFHFHFIFLFFAGVFHSFQLSFHNFGFVRYFPLAFEFDFNQGSSSKFYLLTCATTLISFHLIHFQILVNFIRLNIFYDLWQRIITKTSGSVTVDVL